MDANIRRALRKNVKNSLDKINNTSFMSSTYYQDSSIELEDAYNFLFQIAERNTVLESSNNKINNWSHSVGARNFLEEIAQTRQTEPELKLKIWETKPESKLESWKSNSKKKMPEKYRFCLDVEFGEGTGIVSANNGEIPSEPFTLKIHNNSLKEEQIERGLENTKQYKELARVSFDHNIAKSFFEQQERGQYDLFLSDYAKMEDLRGFEVADKISYIDSKSLPGLNCTTDKNWSGWVNKYEDNTFNIENLSRSYVPPSPLPDAENYDNSGKPLAPMLIEAVEEARADDFHSITLDILGDSGESFEEIYDNLNSNPENAVINSWKI